MKRCLKPIKWARDWSGIYPKHRVEWSVTGNLSAQFVEAAFFAYCVLNIKGNIYKHNTFGNTICIGNRQID